MTPGSFYGLIYFFSLYSINENESEQHVSILDCETGRVRRGYAQPSNHFTGKLNF